MQTRIRQIAWVSLLLMLWSALAFATHHHSSQDESTTCQVCVAAQSSSPSTAALAPKPVFYRRITFRPQVASAKQRLEAFALYVRPPPSV